MKQLLLIVLLIIALVLSVTAFFTREETPDITNSDLSTFQQRVQEKSVSFVETVPSGEEFNWISSLEKISGAYDLDITIKESSALQVELAVNDANYDDLINAFAELYAQGIRFQSIRLLKTDTPGMVKADSIRLINSN